MHIIGIKQYNKNNELNFAGKISAKKVLPAFAVLTPTTAIADSFTNNNLYNKSADDNKRIEEYLNNAVQSQERISKQKISEDLGISIKTCERKIRRGNPLYDLWLKTNHTGIKKDETPNEAVVENKKRLESINSKLWRIVNEAYENKTPLTYSQLARELGITPQNCVSRIKNNKELVDKWNQIEHPRITEESENINQQIAEIIQEAKGKGRIVSYQAIAEKVGITKDGVEQRIRTYPQLKALIAQTRYSRISEESQDINERIEDVLRQAKKDNIKIKIADIAEKLNLPFLNVRERLRRYPVLVDLWAKTPHHQGRVTNRSEENTNIDLKIKERLKYYTDNNIPVSMNEIASDVGIPYSKLKQRFEFNRELAASWKITPRKNIGGKRDYTQGENENLIRIMENYASLGIRVDGIQLSKETGMTLAKFRAKLKHYPDVKTSWQRLKELDKKASDDVNKKIENVLRQAVKNKTPLSARELERTVGTNRNACFQRIYQDEVLNGLWVQVKANEHKQVIEKQNKIKTTLENAIKENKKIRIYDIAEKTGISPALCFYYISKVPELQELWQQFEHNLVREETIELSNEIKNILTEANNRGERLHLKDIAEFTQSDFINVRDKVKRSDELTKLWEENKKINYSLLKQLNSLKQQNLTEDEIKLELDLEDDVFENLINEYMQLSKVLEIHNDENISDEEYMSWAVLSKREYELITNKIFEKMGYKAKTTRYNADGGVDVIAERNGKTTIIECIHNLTKKEKAREVLALEGVKKANNINEAILVTASGLHFNAEGCVEKINENNPNSFKVLTLEDMIKLAKKYNIDITSVDFNEFEENNETMLNSDISTWYFKKSDKITNEDRDKWLNVPYKEYENKIIELFIQKGYSVLSISRTVGQNGYYELEKDGVKTIINCGTRNSIPEIDDIRSLYGCINAFGAKKAILIGTSGISASGKSFIDLINGQEDKKDSFKLIGFDKLIEMIKICN